ncbi:HTH domain-containing protein [archaeon]|jgi:DNA-binding CsgD family transcriptional regulator|nr:HTH domain-containing protein [archaeon]
MVWWNFSKKEHILEEKFSEIRTVLESSFGKVKTDMSDVSEWIKHLECHRTEHNESIKNIEERLRLIETSIFHTKAHNSQYNLNEIEHVQTFKRSNQTIMNVQNIEDLTPAQKQVVGLLIYAEEAMTYEDISKKLGINIVTVRRHINDVKRAGIKINEKVSVKSRKKMFLVDESLKELILANKLG